MLLCTLQLVAIWSIELTVYSLRHALQSGVFVFDQASVTATDEWVIGFQDVPRCQQDTEAHVKVTTQPSGATSWPKVLSARQKG